MAAVCCKWSNKNPGLTEVSPGLFTKELVVGGSLSVAIAAEHGTIGLGQERNLAGFAATSADDVILLTGGTGSVLASVTAGLAALGLVLEAALCVELLLTSGEHELVAALFAN